MSAPVLYAFHLPDPIPFEDYETLLALLSPAERERVQRYRLEQDRLRSLVSRVALWYHLLAKGLLQSADSPPRFRSGPRGKPYLTTSLRRPAQKGSDVEEAVKVGFNVSHEGRWVLLGVLEITQSSGAEAEAPEVGVDVMVPPSDPFDLKEALIPQMTLSERRFLSIPLTPAQLRWSLSSLWALKEGYTKAVGDGVGFGLDRIQVGFADSAATSASLGLGSQAANNSSAQSGNETGRMEASLPVLSVQVDGQDVRDAGWEWAIGTVGSPGSLDQVGWAMYWQLQEQGRAAAGSNATVAGGPAVRVVEWEELVGVFDDLPSYDHSGRDR